MNEKIAMRGSACAAKRSRPASVRIRGWQRSPEQSASSQQLRPTEGDPLKDGRLRARSASRRQSRCTGSLTTVRTPGSSSDESSGDGSSGASERPQSCRPGTQGLPASEVDATSARSRLRQARKTLRLRPWRIEKNKTLLHDCMCCSDVAIVACACFHTRAFGQTRNANHAVRPSLSLLFSSLFFPCTRNALAAPPRRGGPAGA